MPAVCVQAPAAYGGNMLSGEIVSWPGLLSPGTDGCSLGPEDRVRHSRYRASAVLPWLFLSARWPLDMPAPLCGLWFSDLIGFPSKLNGKDKFQYNGLGFM